jgi:hypothetical protein
MAAILSSILFGILGRFVSEKVLNALVIKLISLALQRLKAKTFFSNADSEKILDEAITVLELAINDKSQSSK